MSNKKKQSNIIITTVYNISIKREITYEEFLEHFSWLLDSVADRQSEEDQSENVGFIYD